MLAQRLDLFNITVWTWLDVTFFNFCWLACAITTVWFFYKFQSKVCSLSRSTSLWAFANLPISPNTIDCWKVRSKFIVWQCLFRYYSELINIAKIETERILKNLPAHGVSLQATSSMAPPLHGSPPNCACWNTVRLLCMVPPPQSWLHTDHAL